jgi:murein L,D-transpeptidase YafK
MADTPRKSRAVAHFATGHRFSRRLLYSVIAGVVATCCFAAAFVAGMGEKSSLASTMTARVTPQPETLLVKSLLEIKENRMDSALTEIETVLKMNPNFRLAQLIKGDLLTARARALTSLGNSTAGMGDQIDDLRDEAKARLLRYEQDIPRNEIPKYLVQLDRKQKYAIVVDLGRSTLFLYENQNGNIRYVSDYYISIGKNGIDKEKEGDKKTPTGVYYVVSKMPQDQLADLYGIGAFPLNYPNEWDKREGREGHGIWLHGTPSDTYSRPPRASDGCVVLTNQDLEMLEKNLQTGLTPVILTKGIEWSPAEDIARTRRELQTQIEDWRDDWESLNTPHYLEHYAQDFLSERQNLSDWAKHKYRVNSTKSWAKIKLDQISIFLYPGRDDMAVVNFDQDYASSNFTYRTKKRQYWILENGRWKIIYEGAA